MSAEGAAKKPRRRLWKILLGVVVLLVLLVLALPTLAAPLVRSKVEDALEQELAVDAEIQGLSFTLGGSLHVSGLRLTDEQGRVVVELERLDASVAPLQALGGTYAFDALVDGLTVHLHEEADGTWSASRLPRKKAEKEKEEEDKGPSSFDLRGQAKLARATCDFIRRDGTVVSTKLDASAAFEGPAAPARFHLALEIIDAGSMVADAELPGDPGAWGDTAGLTGSASLAFERPLELATIGSALGPVLPFELRAGTLGGKGEVSLGRGLDLKASAAFALDGLEVQGPRAGAAPLKLQHVTLEASTVPGADGANAPHLAVKADDALALAVDGTLRGAGGPDARLDGTLALDGDIGALARLSLGWVAFQEGLALEGQLKGSGTFDVAMAKQTLSGAGAKLEFGLEHLAARDAVKGPLDLGPLTGAKLTAEARYDAPTGELRVPAFALDAGALRAEGTALVVSKAGEAPRLGPTRLDASADLDVLGSTLSGLFELGDTHLGGRVEAHVEASGEGTRLPLQARLVTQKLVYGAQSAAATEYGDVTATLQGLYDGGAGTLALDELSVRCTGLDVHGKASLAGLDRKEGTPDAEFDLVVDADPSDLPAWVQGMLGDKRIAGADVRVRLAGAWKAGAADATADLAGRNVEVVLPGTLSFRAASLRQTMHVVGPPEALDLKGDGELLAVDLQLEPAPPAAGAKPAQPPATAAKPLALNEPRLVYALDLLYAQKPGDLTLRKLHLESLTASGDVSGRITGLASLSAPAASAAGAEGAAAKPDVVIEGLQGDLTYVPDKLALVLGPLLPGELTGSEPEPCRFRLDGRIQGLDAPALIAGLAGTVDVGLGRYRQTGLDVGGDAHLELKDGAAKVTSTLSANGGELALGGDVRIVPGPEGLMTENPHITLGAKDVQANAQLSPLLGFVHPAFASLESAKGGEIGGLIDCNVDLSYDGQLDAAALAGGFEALPKQPINGSISFALNGGSLATSPLVKQVLEKLNLGSTADFALKPIAIDVKQGRLHYAKPWEWTMLGSNTSFGGSIGLDKTLDLKWTVPITAELAARNELLGHLQGQTLAINIGGTVTHPAIDTGDMLKGLVKDAAQGVIEKELKEALGSITGGDPGKGGGAAQGAGKEKGAEDAAQGPDDLLKRADDLWKKGDKAAAVPLYKELRDKHKLSLVYVLNKDRIKDRADWKP